MTDSIETLKSFLTRTPFFGGLSDEALERVIGMLKERRFPLGSTVFREGEQGRSMYIIATGRILMSQQGESGSRIRLFRLGAGDFFGETTLIEMHPRPYTAEVEVETTLYELTNSDLYRLYKEDVRAYVLVLQNINRELCRRLRKADERITQMADQVGDEHTQITTHPNQPLPRPPFR
jgi:CRP/FNR family cyclic AMP-dependent transcriptional regulator